MVYHRIVLPLTVISLIQVDNEWSYEYYRELNTPASIVVCLHKHSSLESVLTPLFKAYPDLKVCMVDTNSFEGSSTHINDVTHYYRNT